MANTFNLGNGNWAQKTEKLLAYNAENDNYKPLPFDFDRGSTATRVNRDGLIETVGVDEPRIDFLNNTKGHLLLEPQRRNLVEYSDFSSGWNLLSGGSIAYNQSISPDGTQNAAILSGDGLNGNSIYDSISVSVQSYTLSVFAKQKDISIIGLRGFSAGAAGTSKFNLSNGTIDTASGGEFSDEKIEDYGNGWYRCSVKVTATSSGSKLFGFSGENSDSGELFSIYGAQFEAGSYATSYIPTSGQSGGVTRSAEDIELLLPDVTSFNSSIGFSVISKFDIGAAGSGTSSPFLSFNDNTSNTFIGFGSNSENLRCRLNLSGTAYLNTQGNAPRTQKNSLFVSCDANGWSQGANGITNHTGSNDASVFDKMSSITYTPSEIYGIIKISELLIYNTRLSDSELQALTS